MITKRNDTKIKQSKVRMFVKKQKQRGPAVRFQRVFKTFFDSTITFDMDLNKSRVTPGKKLSQLII